MKPPAPHTSAVFLRPVRVAHRVPRVRRDRGRQVTRGPRKLSMDPPRYPATLTHRPVRADS